uniref:Uncharacterized protein n=2 Tax=Phaeomonas parva TaxID=124430 RepID=A0A7S1XWI5_9STRA|mmetsp:Transcript_39821/g.124451  ORF Transcript_39821/g.124451 Transcript_39821/m.124451 type:complete len:1209 (+) Transcript_39821:2-3628(+)
MGRKFGSHADEVSASSWGDSYAGGFLGTARRLGEKASFKLMSLRRKNSAGGEDPQQMGESLTPTNFRLRGGPQAARPPPFTEEEILRLVNLEWAEERLMSVLRVLAVGSLVEKREEATDAAATEVGSLADAGKALSFDSLGTMDDASVNPNGTPDAMYPAEDLLLSPAEGAVPQPQDVGQPESEEPLEFLLLTHGPPDPTLSINERLERIKRTLRRLVGILDFKGRWVRAALRDLREPLCLLLDVDCDFVLLTGEEGEEGGTIGGVRGDGDAASAPVRRLFLNMAFSLELLERSVVIVPLVHRLATSPSVCARILCSNLIPDLYMQLPLPQQLQLRGVVTRFIYDKVPLVRKCATKALGRFSSRCDATAVPWLLLLLERCANDAEAEVREKAIDVVLAYSICLPYAMTRLSQSLLKIASGQMGEQAGAGDRASPSKSATPPEKPEEEAETTPKTRKRRMSTSKAFGALADVGLGLGTESIPVYRGELHLLRCKLLPIATTLAEDLSWAVRTAVARKCHALCGSLGDHWSAVVVDLLASLLEDRAAKVRAAAAANLPRLAEILSKFAVAADGTVDEGIIRTSRLKLMQALLPPAAKIAADRHVVVRVALARALVRVATATARGDFGKDAAEIKEVDDAVVPLMRKQFLDDDQQVRNAAVAALAARPLISLSREERVYAPRWAPFALEHDLLVDASPRLDLRAESDLGSELGSEIGLGVGLGAVGFGFGGFGNGKSDDEGDFESLRAEDALWTSFIKTVPPRALAVPPRLSLGAASALLDTISQQSKLPTWRTRVQCAMALPSCGAAAYNNRDLTQRVRNLVVNLLNDPVELVRRKAAEALVLIGIAQPISPPKADFDYNLYVRRIRETLAPNLVPRNGGASNGTAGVTAVAEGATAEAGNGAALVPEAAPDAPDAAVETIEQAASALRLSDDGAVREATAAAADGAVAAGAGEGVEDAGAEAKGGGDEEDGEGQTNDAGTGNEDGDDDDDGDDDNDEDVDEHWAVRDSLTLPPKLDLTQVDSTSPYATPSAWSIKQQREAGIPVEEGEQPESRLTPTREEQLAIEFPPFTGAWLWDVFLPIIVTRLWNRKAKNRLIALHGAATAYAVGLVALGQPGVYSEDGGAGGDAAAPDLADIIGQSMAKLAEDPVTNVRIAFARAVGFCGDVAGPRILDDLWSAKVTALLRNEDATVRELASEAAFVIGHAGGQV